MAEESVINRMQHRYWITKQTVFKKLGKKEDEFIISSDAELDAKLELFKSVQESSRNLLRIINQYENNLNILALEESEMGHFMKSAGKIDKTRAGKMMITVGTAILYGGQQRFALQRPLERLYQKLETFHRRAVADTSQVIQCMERARTEYRASLNWMKDISQELDPDTYKQLERFKKVQERVKKSKSRFDRLKHVCVTKIDVLVASRSNMFSNLLLLYEKSLLEFTQKCCSTYTVIANSFKGYQHYDFCVVKELSDLKPDSSIIAKEENCDESLLEFEEDNKHKNAKNGEVSAPLQGPQDLLTLDVSNSADDLISSLLSADIQPQPSNTQIPVTNVETTACPNLFLPSYLLSLHEPSELFTRSDGKIIPALNNLTNNKAASKPNSWYDLFAELDPLADPDSEILRRDWLFKLVGQELFKINETTCVIKIDPHGLFNYSYSLTVDGKSLDTFTENRSKICNTWLVCLTDDSYRVILEKGTLDVWVNGKRIDTQVDFVENGTETIFYLGETVACIKAVPCCGKKDGILYSLIVNDDIIKSTD